MKTLLILRHGKSRWDKRGVADHERGLKPRGRRDAARAGRWLRENELVPDQVLSSTAKRARKTAKRVAKECAFAGETQLHAELYLSDPTAYLDALRQLPAESRRVLIVGHNPGLEELLQELTGKAESLPTAALAQVELPIELWSDLDHEVRGEIKTIWRPKDAKRAKKAERFRESAEQVAIG
jgi:phosphohistidine phosphatase